MITLREITADDLIVINKWHNDQELYQFLGGPFRYVNIETDMHWFENYMNNRQKQVRCAICDSANQIIGTVNLLNMDYVTRTAEYSILIETKHRGKGVGKRATLEILKHAFLNLNLHKVYLYVLEHNIRAIQLYETVGFKTEGKLRDAIFKLGKYENLLIMSILESEFHEQQEM